LAERFQASASSLGQQAELLDLTTLDLPLVHAKSPSSPREYQRPLPLFRSCWPQHLAG
jgi:hypothetical protein